MQGKKNTHKNRIAWMLASLPANLATGPLSILITLFILKLGGGILNVAYALTLASAITIPAVFLWGYLTDLLNKRKIFVIAAYLLTTILIFGLFFVKTVVGITIIYAIFAFVWAASIAPLNLLVMENSRKNRWAQDFSTLQTISGIGATLSLLVAWIVTGVSTLSVLLLILTVSALISTVMAAKLIKEPKILKHENSLHDGAQAFMYRLVAIPNVLIKIPNPKHIRDFFKFDGSASIQKKFVMVFYIISFIFFFGTAIFNTEYTVGLKLYGISNSLIFFLNLIAMIVQTAIFYYYGRLTKKTSSSLVAKLSLFGRGSAYIAMGLLFVFFNGLIFYTGNFIFYILAIGITYALYYPTSYAILFRTLSGENKGSAMGVYSAVIGIGTLLGALASGILSVNYGFGITFVLAGGLMLLCGYLFRLLPKM